MTLKIVQIYLIIKIENFFQTNDVNLSKIINKFSKIKKGIDLLYIDSYHEPSHSKEFLICIIHLLMSMDIFLSNDTSSYPFRKLNILTDSINSDYARKKLEFFYSNFDAFEFKMRKEWFINIKKDKEQ